MMKQMKALSVKNMGHRKFFKAKRWKNWLRKTTSY